MQYKLSANVVFLPPFSFLNGKFFSVKGLIGACREKNKNNNNYVQFELR